MSISISVQRFSRDLLLPGSPEKMIIDTRRGGESLELPHIWFELKHPHAAPKSMKSHLLPAL